MFNYLKYVSSDHIIQINRSGFGIMPEKVDMLVYRGLVFISLSTQMGAVHIARYL